MDIISAIPNQQIANTLFNITSMASKGFSSECVGAGNQKVFPKAFPSLCSRTSAEGIEGVAVHPLWVTLV